MKGKPTQTNKNLNQSIKMVKFPSDRIMKEESNKKNVCEKCEEREEEDSKVQRLQEQLTKKQRENDFLQTEIKKCQTEIIIMLREELSHLRQENAHLLEDIENLQHKMNENLKISNKRSEDFSRLDFQQILKEILHGEAPARFQRLDT